MTEYIEIRGYLDYDPDRQNMKNRTQYWCVLQLPNDLVRYYQYFVRKEHHVDMQMPAWGAHVSIIRGEKPDDNHIHLWKKYHKQKFTIRFNPYIDQVKDKKQSGSFYIINFESPELMKIREELGLSVHNDFHLTIGRTYYD
ncbi:hypothetical protein [Yersinia phage fHe-Yen9-04]|uniref:Swiss Army Knife 2H phosphoesterase domain-containing protein n=1 Tax=Yersinia phage fHe-Yen9-04 TaxID=2052742 RepID=A0A2C9CXC4_9CAUD|nr:hypothetical protein FDJ41_gp178 [Yersinia phage fHe-Yen9-04]SOK58455.1 hypothetical protein [Yersinia phage fHe-Yen9-04]VUE36224.1 hypothetical protein [Yersinia phage fHe-Yen9-04]